MRYQWGLLQCTFCCGSCVRVLYTYPLSIEKWDYATLCQAPVHEAALLEGHPPFAGLSSTIGVQLFHQPRRKLLPDLR